MTAIDWVAVTAYLVIITAVGLYFGRYMRQVADFFKGGNEIPWWLSGISAYMTAFSAFVFVAYAGMAYRYGFMAATLCWTAVPAYLLAAYVFAPLWRRTGVLTPVEYLERRYNVVVRQLFGWVGIPVRLIDDALKIVAMGTFIAVIMEIEMPWAIVGLGAIVVLYCVIGGLWAVVITDMIQFVVLSVTLGLVVPLSLIRVGGLGKLIADSPEGFFHLLNPANAEKGWGYLGVFIVLVLLSYNSTWSLIQRSCCVKNERAARKASLLAAVLYFVTPPLWILPAICARQLLPPLADGGQSFVLLCKEILPAGFLGIVLAGMFSATMSSLSSDYNIFAGVITQDFYRRLIDSRATERRLLWVGRLSLLAVGAVAIGIAICVMVTKTKLFDGMVKNFGIALPPMAVPLLGGLIYRRTSAVGAIVTYVAGLATALTLHFGCDASTQAVTGYNILVSTVVFFGWGLVLPWRSAAEEARVRALFEHMSRPVGQEEIAAIERRATAGPSPLFITGTILCAIGGLLALLGLAPMRWEARLTNWILAGILIALGIAGIRLRTRPAPGADER